LRLLLDTHTLLWFLAGDSGRIKAPLRARIEEVTTTVSVVAVWEIAIKSALGKLEVPHNSLPDRLVELGFELLPVTAEHAWAVRRLPPNHGDPFDRLLIAQAQVERLPVVTADASFADYGVQVVWD
jgi:PIN domain nuclease of toxin-antitoxin system